MFERIGAGWKLGKASRKLIFKDKKLLFFPLVSAFFGILETSIIFGLLGAFYLNISSLLPSNSGTYSQIFIFLAFLLLYIFVSFTSTFLIISMYTSLDEFEKGNTIGVIKAMSLSKPYIGLAFKWGLFSGIVLTVIRVIESRFRGVGAIIIADLGGLALSMASLFAVPVIYEKKIGPIQAVKESFRMIVSFFGPTFGGFAYIDIFGLAIVGLGFLVLIGGLVLLGLGSGFLAFFIVLVVAIIIIITGILITQASSNVFRLVLYNYSQGKGLPKDFDADEETIRQAMKRKRGSVQI